MLKNGLNFILIVVSLVALVMLYYFIISHLLIKDTFAIPQADTPNQEQLIKDTKARIAWKYKFNTDGLSLIYPTINDSEKYLYVSVNKTIYCIEKEDGDKVWEYSVPDIIIGKPITADDTVYFIAGNKVYAVDINGENKWNYQINANIEPSLMISNGILYFGSADNKIYAVSKNGHLIWNINIDGKISAPPAASEGKLYIGDLSKQMYAVDADNGHVIWKVSLLGELQGTPVTIKDTLFFSSVVSPTDYSERETYLYAVSTQNGYIKWRNYTKALSLTAPAFYNGLIYVGDANGKLYTYEYQWGQIKWEFQKEETQLTSPIIVDTTVFFQSNDNRLYAVDIVSGKLLWEVIIEGIIKTPPIIDNEHTYFYSSGYLCALKNKV